MLAENKFSKYLFYAVGEIVLVVIGILIALQINTWNQDRMNSENEANILLGLREEFIAADKELEADHFARISIIKTAETVLTLHLDNTSLNISQDSIQGFFNRFFSFRYYTTAHPVLDDLHTSGRLNLIKSDAIRHALSLYIQEINRYEIIEERERLFATDQLIPFFSDYLDLSLIAKNRMLPREVDSILLSVSSKSKLGSLLNRKILYTERAIEYGLRVDQAIDNVLVEIDREL